MNTKALERGYSSTGYIPKIGDDLSKIGEMEREEMKMEKHEKMMAKMYGHKEEVDVGGFLERNNTDDRM